MLQTQNGSALLKRSPLANPVALTTLTSNLCADRAPCGRDVVCAESISKLSSDGGLARPRASCDKVPGDESFLDAGVGSEDDD
eukprot:CAMPEP_0180581290 /NCGR_PEP_ID=MMETSP1037_2-20121125/13973_1 /TAXON_ID=632150 /ORGANISM="Azadinium spinosum, Strain 3D9" /LENGTH=82 /DNA_ID=CAMNT_0022599263 /DNA_START=205 /DNA_END=453 /DNA_ORIENTATION=-